MKYEDWQSKYEQILAEYKAQKIMTTEMQDDMAENQ